MDMISCAKAKKKRYLLNLNNLESADGTPVTMNHMLEYLIGKLFSGESPSYHGEVKKNDLGIFWEVADEWAKKAYVHMGYTLNQCIDDTPPLVVCSNGGNFAPCAFVGIGTYSWDGSGKELRVGNLGCSSTVLFGANLYTLHLSITRLDVERALYSAVLIDNGQVTPND